MAPLLLETRGDSALLVTSVRQEVRLNNPALSDTSARFVYPSVLAGGYISLIALVSLYSVWFLSVNNFFRLPMCLKSACFLSYLLTNPFFLQTAGMSVVTDDDICPDKYYCPAGTDQPDSNECTAGKICLIFCQLC